MVGWSCRLLWSAGGRFELQPSLRDGQGALRAAGGRRSRATFVKPLHGGSSGTPSRVRGVWRRGYRWSFHLGVERPPATICQPFGLVLRRGGRTGGGELTTMFAAIRSGLGRKGDGTLSEFDWVLGRSPRVAPAGATLGWRTQSVWD